MCICKDSTVLLDDDVEALNSLARARRVVIDVQLPATRVERPPLHLRAAWGVQQHTEYIPYLFYVIE